MKKVTIGICESIAIYKVCSLISFFKNENIEIQIIMTKNVTNFINPLIFETLSKKTVITDIWTKY